MQHHEGRNITRYQVGYLIGKAWKKAASVGNAVSGFKATGIFPLNPNVIPNHLYSLSDTTSPPSQSDITCPDPKPSTSRAKTPPLAFPNPSPSTSQTRTPPTLSSKSPSIVSSNESPSKHLHEISPIPKLPLPRSKRSRQSATVLTSPEHIEKCKKSQENKAKKNKLQTDKHNSNKNTRRKRRAISESSEDIEEGGSESQKNLQEVDSNNCTECWENYYTTKEKADWIRCQDCNKWMHENCTMYGNVCNNCGRQIKRNEVLKLRNKK